MNMKLFKDSRGHIIAFGFSMLERKPNDSMICWCDPQTLEWDAGISNLAGHAVLPYGLIAPEFVFETREGTVVAYQPGRCIELTHVGHPWIFSIRDIRDWAGAFRSASN